MLLKTKFFVVTTICYFLALIILLLASLESYYSLQGAVRYAFLNIELICFLLITLFFIAINVICYLLLQTPSKEEKGDDSNVLLIDHQRLFHILNVFDEAIIVFDFDGNIVIWNKMAELLLEVKFEESQKDLLNYTSVQNHTIIKKALFLIHKALDAGCVLKDTVDVDQKKQMALTASPIMSPPRILLIMQDISNNNKISQMGKDFIANASHELRTPVTIIKGFAETLKDLPTVSESMLEDITDKIIRSCERMNALVKNLLLLADLDHSKKFSFRPCDLASLIESCSYSILAIHPEVCIETLQNEDEILIEADPDLFEQAIMNLFENAIRYSLKPAHITVTIKREEAKVTLTIQDRGIGIEQDDLNHIFDRFYRVNKDRSRKLGGTGLGLSIVHSIIEKHHGEICVTSKKNHGTAFIMTFLAYTTHLAPI
ncbi:MAG: ATP-binding protein [Simkaniaceae bacterium]|nr:ATP-binding protein [Simkaniaceae bacterium]MCF7851990.1 ATP-binding protein [Simkaniaceae bacterium]